MNDREHGGFQTTQRNDGNDQQRARAEAAAESKRQWIRNPKIDMNPHRSFHQRPVLAMVVSFVILSPFAGDEDDQCSPIPAQRHCVDHLTTGLRRTDAELVRDYYDAARASNRSCGRNRLHPITKVSRAFSTITARLKLKLRTQIKRCRTSARKWMRSGAICHRKRNSGDRIQAADSQFARLYLSFTLIYFCRTK